MRRVGIFGDDGSGSLGGASTLWGAKPAARDHEARFIKCDRLGCPESIPLALHDFGLRAGWVISDETDLCPEHAEGYMPSVPKELPEPQVEVNCEEEDIETPPPIVAQPPPRRSSSGEWVAAVVAILIMVLMISTMWLGERMLLDEEEMTRSNERAFISEYFVLPNHCSGFQTKRCDGIMATPGQPQIPVRFTCDKDACSFDCK